jgi:purine-binding chemotaxis protein CheW
VIPVVPLEVNNRVFGIEISYIKELIVKKEFFVVPKVPDFTVGFINLRGEVVPCFDLQNILFGTKRKFDGDVINFAVMLRVSGKSLGFVVDKVMKVMYIDETNLKGYIEDIWKDVKFVKYFIEVSNSLMAIIDVESVLKYIDKVNKEFYKYVRR